MNIVDGMRQYGRMFDIKPSHMPKLQRRGAKETQISNNFAPRKTRVSSRCFAASHPGVNASMRERLSTPYRTTSCLPFESRRTDLCSACLVKCGCRYCPTPSVHKMFVPYVPHDQLSRLEATVRGISRLEPSTLGNQSTCSIDNGDRYLATKTNTRMLVGRGDGERKRSKVER